jgi:hypothetical protein
MGESEYRIQNRTAGEAERSPEVPVSIPMVRLVAIDRSRVVFRAEPPAWGRLWAGVVAGAGAAAMMVSGAVAWMLQSAGWAVVAAGCGSMTLTATVLWAVLRRAERRVTIDLRAGVVEVVEVRGLDAPALWRGGLDHLASIDGVAGPTSGLWVLRWRQEDVEPQPMTVAAAQGPAWAQRRAALAEKLGERPVEGGQ